MKTFLVAVSILLFLSDLAQALASIDKMEWLEESLNISLSFRTAAEDGDLFYLAIDEDFWGEDGKQEPQ